MKMLRRVLIVLGVVLALLLAVPALVSLDTWRPQVEQALASRLGTKVVIGRLALSGLPYPRVMADTIAVGDNGELQARELVLAPDWLSLFSATKVIRSIAIDGLGVRADALGALGRLGGSGEASPSSTTAAPALRIDAIALTNTRIGLSQTVIGPFDAAIAFDANAQFASAQAALQDGTLALTAMPASGAYALALTANNWTVPVGPALRFAALDARGTLRSGVMTIDSLKAQAYGGTLDGAARLSWDTRWRLSGTLDGKTLDVRELTLALSSQAPLAGKLDAQAKFDAAADSAAALGRALRLDMPFAVTGGVLTGMDLKGIAQRIADTDALGETRFDTLRGRLSVVNDTLTLADIAIRSGALQADGKVTATPERRLSGRVDVGVIVAGKLGVAAPLDVSGTLDAPRASLATGAILERGVDFGKAAAQWARQFLPR